MESITGFLMVVVFGLGGWLGKVWGERIARVESHGLGVQLEALRAEQCFSGKNFLINTADRTTIARDGVQEFSGGAPATTHGDPVLRSRIDRENGFAHRAPTPQNAFDSAQLLVVLD